MTAHTDTRPVAKKCPASAAMLRLVRDISECVDSLADSRDVLRCALGEFAQVAGFAAGHAFQLVEGDMLASSELWWQRDGNDVIPLSAASRRCTLVADEGVPGRALASGKAAWTVEFDVDDELPRQAAARASGIRTALAFPVLIGERVVALFEFFDGEPREPSPELLDAVSVVGTTVGRVFERLEIEQQRRETATLEETVLNNAGDAFVSIDSDGLVTGWNRESERMFGYPADEAIGAVMADLIMPADYRSDHAAGIKNYMATGHGRVPDRYVELEAIRKSGERFPIEMAFWGMRIHGDWNFFSFTRDITERKAREAALEYRATHDEVTGLPNRASAVDYLTEALQQGGPRDRRVSLLLIDLDRFSVMRERLGYHAAQALLRIAAERIQGAVGDRGWTARVGDDEFVVIGDGTVVAGGSVDGDGSVVAGGSVDSDGSVAGDGAAALADTVVEALHPTVELNEDQISVGASMAVLLADSEGDSAEDLLRDASAGLAVSRQQRRGDVQVFDDAARTEIRQRLALERELAVGIDEGQLRLHYQPLMDFAGETLIGFEALVRWQHPERGLLSPAAFVDLAEESGLIVPLGTWVIEEACRQAAAWQRAGYSGLTIAVNLSARQFAQSDLIDTIADAIDRYGVDTAKIDLTLEVTETLVMNDPDATARTLADLHDRGFMIAIDDFGTGYSSLAYLKAFPVDTVKIDRAFVMNVDTDPHNRAIVAAVIQLGHALGLRVLAEGIETDAERACLAEMGCDLAQGYFFGRPGAAQRDPQDHVLSAQ